MDRKAGTLTVEWPLRFAARRIREAGCEELDGLIEKLEGAKLIADFEARYDLSDAAAREQLFKLSEWYGLASSEMLLVAL